MTGSAFTSVQPAPTDTCPGIDVVSTPARCRSWQLAHEMFSASPFATRAGGDSRLIAVSWVAVPENAGSKKNIRPISTAAELSDRAFDRSGGGGGGFASDATRAHSPSFQPHPSDTQNALSASLPQLVSASRVSA